MAGWSAYFSNSYFDQKSEVLFVIRGASPLSWVFPVEVQAVELVLLQEGLSGGAELLPSGSRVRNSNERLAGHVPAADGDERFHFRILALQSVELVVPVRKSE